MHLKLIRFFKVAIGFAAVALATDVAAQERLLKCELKPAGYYKGTPPEVLVAYNAGEERMAVFDSFLAHLERDPVLGRVTRDNDKLFIIKWQVDDMETASGHQMDWRLTLIWQKASGRATISGKAAVSDGDNSGSGSCKFIK